MPRATWNGATLADSDETVRLEGNHYFPPEAVNWEHLVESPSASLCFWKGKARYYNVTVDDDVNVNAAFTYPKPWLLARRIKDHVAFWQGVEVRD